MDKISKDQTTRAFFSAFDATPPPDGNAAPDTLQNVALMSVGEALGHGIDIDHKSLEQVVELCAGKRLKSFNNHCYAPAATDIIGAFSDIYLDGDKVRARTFEFLETVDAATKSRLLELAAKIPDQFGVSLSTECKGAWKLEGGGEAEFDLFDFYWGMVKKPENAICERPVARFKRIFSGDFVSTPAANPDGLFSARQPAAAIPKNTKTQKKGLSMKKHIEYFATRFGKGTAKFAAACARLADFAEDAEIDEKAVGDEVEKTSELEEAKKQIEELQKRISELEAENADLKKQLEDSKGETQKAQEENKELSAKLAAAGQFGADAHVDMGDNPAEPKKPQGKFAASKSRLAKQFGGK